MPTHLKRITPLIHSNPGTEYHSVIPIRAAMNKGNHPVEFGLQNPIPGGTDAVEAQPTFLLQKLKFLFCLQDPAILNFLQSRKIIFNLHIGSNSSEQSSTNWEYLEVVSTTAF